MSRRRLRRKSEKAQRHATPLYTSPTPPREIVREATRVERLTYTRTQAAEALGVSRSTFNRRILPLIETVEMPWGARQIPVDELQRLLTERRRPAREREQRGADPGRPATLAPSIVERIRAEHGAGRSLGQIARELNAEQVPTAHGGAQWWPSTVRAVLRRASASESAFSSTATTTPRLTFSPGMSPGADAGHFDLGRPNLHGEPANAECLTGVELADEAYADRSSDHPRSKPRRDHRPDGPSRDIRPGTRA